MISLAGFVKIGLQINLQQTDSLGGSDKFSCSTRTFFYSEIKSTKVKDSCSD